MKKLMLFLFLTAIFFLNGCSDKVTSDESEVTWESYLTNTNETRKVLQGR